jgi:hypothetical protein
MLLADSYARRAAREYRQGPHTHLALIGQLRATWSKCERHVEGSHQSRTTFFPYNPFVTPDSVQGINFAHDTYQPARTGPPHCKTTTPRISNHHPLHLRPIHFSPESSKSASTRRQSSVTQCTKNPPDAHSAIQNTRKVQLPTHLLHTTLRPPKNHVHLSAP